MNQPTVLLKKEKNVATITLNRPERMNVLNPELLDTLVTTIEEVKQDSAVRATILTGAGQVFSAGAELTYPLFRLTNAVETEQFINQIGSIVFNLRTMDKPVVVAVNGAAVGGALGFVLAGDIIIASDKARFSTGFTGIGIHPDNGVTYLLPRLVGFVRASELLLTNRIVNAEEAERIGMVNKVVPPELLETTAKDLAISLAQGAPIAMGMTKNSLNRSLGMDLASMLKLEAKAESICFHTEDCKEGVEAFLQKRKAVFKGR